ncbi:MAG: hypothetical protein GX799_10845, partial [Crenarchaeota archaeon]|nr:hypothetical protein [Thermoproteota archaeon]
MKSITDAITTAKITKATTKSGNGNGSTSEPVLMVGIGEVGLGEAVMLKVG